MNTNNIKSYAPKARKDFIAAISKQAAKYGITAKAILPAEVKGDLLMIGERAFPKAILKPRSALVQLVEQKGFDVVIEQVAYSWFNRLCAIRYLELHDYLGHGRRVLSHPTDATGYQILEECLDIDLPGLDQNLVRELKLDGTKDEELYRELLLAQCHALHNAMPFLFEPVDDETELLLPENLTKTDSLIHDLITEVPEQDWDNIEIVGWLYQFYISEKKDQVIGKVVKSEDIPAATQLFTPNWIVKYMVQNSLGAQWLATYPDSPLKAQMEYYIEPAEQTDEVNAQLKAITPESLNPEELTLIDPASGSGHILVEAYDLFKAIYLERGYRQRDIAQLILEKNLFGLDIDQRAAQLTGFALMMKGREDDRRLFERGVKLNVMAMVDSTSLDVDTLVHGIELSQFGSTQRLSAEDLTALKDLFEHATTFGSLIQVPRNLAEKLPALKQLSEINSQDMFVSEVLEHLAPLVKQAEILAAQYDAVVANPPYMGRKYQNSILKELLRDYYCGYENDFFSAFTVRCSLFGLGTARIGLMNPNVWMYIATHEQLRVFISEQCSLSNLVELPLSGFKGATVQICTFTFQNFYVKNNHAKFIRLVDFKGGDLEMASQTKYAIKNVDCGWLFESNPSCFRDIPGAPVAYWLSAKLIESFSVNPQMKSYSHSFQGIITGDNNFFLRQWSELNFDAVSWHLESYKSAEGIKAWVPYNKGGAYRKWYGNCEHLLRWNGYGDDLTRGRTENRDYFFREGLTWSDITSFKSSFRLQPIGLLNDAKGPVAYFKDGQHIPAIGLMNSIVTEELIESLNPTISFQLDDFNKIPINETPFLSERLMSIVLSCIERSQEDWNTYERSWNFQTFPLLASTVEHTLESSYTAWVTQNNGTVNEMMRLEEENNVLFIDAYGLQDELSPEVPIEQITLTVNPAYRYGVKGTEEERNTRFREDTMAELVSYAIGCMMGRYSLDEPGLIYANSGNEGFDASRYQKFPADDDGIIPLTDKEWFTDDAANRLVEFISVAWDKSHLEENLDFLAANLSPKKGEDSRDTIRRYLCDKFYKDHMQTYKKRPIYWLFSSGKQKAFQCLVYLHRYNEGTLARMRTEYVIPLTSKMTAYAQKLENDKDASSSAAEIKRIEKELNQLHKQQAELSEFDEKLRHYADQRISLDLDDGVKVNYGKFGDLLAEVKVITGKAPEASK